MSEGETQAAIESVARHSYGRLIAYLAARSGDVAGAEDALGDAFVAALGRWPVDGLPQKPEAWLLHVARNRLNYQPYWAARGHLLRLLDRQEEAEQAFTRAAGLTDDVALRAYLFQRAQSCP